jgi:hypothetical protein
LATTPYNIKRACKEFNFIHNDFFPLGTKVDLDDYEGGLPTDVAIEPQPAPPMPSKDTANGLVVRVPATQPRTDIVNKPQPAAPLKDTVNCLVIRVPATQLPQTCGSGKSAEKENAGMREKVVTEDRVIQGAGFKLRLPQIQPITTKADSGENTIEKETPISEEDDAIGRRTFCPVEYRETIITMMEKHYCAHPSIPGYAAPDREAIRRWAVRQTYDFCVKNKLPEVWAYLWENWYRKGRWELWARSAHDLIPVLKTTMILESQ